MPPIFVVLQGYQVDVWTGEKAGVGEETIMRTPHFSITLALLGSLLLASCGGESGSDQPATGVASLSVTDAAVDDVVAVRLSFDRIDLQPASGSRVSYELDPPVVIDNLLALQGNASATLLPPVVLPAGDYAWVRLYVQQDHPDSYVETDGGGLVDLKIPGQQGNAIAGGPRFLQLVSGFVVPAGGRTDFVLDVDLRRALTQPAGEDFYFLRPALRLVDNAEVGTLSGSIANSLLGDISCSHDAGTGAGLAVYLYDGHDAVTGDVYVNDAGEPIGADNPFTSDSASPDPESSDYLYEIGFIPVGEYTAALTCQGIDDNNDSDDAIGFLQTINVTLSSGETLTRDFN